jgi:hypothetical protein
MWLRWFPWKYFVRRVARAHGFLDPVAVLSRMRLFGQPAEVAEPIELLRAAIVFHARGLMNTRAIQHNLDWVWPFWVERQFDPSDDAFIPRAFSITHVNLTHRNWTAVGLPDCVKLPIVDPRGLVTPAWDGWSLDTWVLGTDGERLLPSRVRFATQALDLTSGIAVVTETAEGGLRVVSRVDVDEDPAGPFCRLRLRASAGAGGFAAVALRPYNPEGVSFVHRVGVEPDRSAWRVEEDQRVTFDPPPDRHAFSNYQAGDVLAALPASGGHEETRCNVGLATAAALFELAPGRPREVTVRVPLAPPSPSVPWDEALAGASRLRVPDERFRFLYDTALRTLVLHSPGEVFPGPYTYKRFWFRDAAFILHGLLVSGLFDRVERALDRFPALQRRSGFFHSQDGEWDSNGEALWIWSRFCALSGRPVKESWRSAIERGTRWIRDKRRKTDGLFPAGFSAEHLGPVDLYYWDDFWGVAGLLAGAEVLGAEEWRDEARDFQRAIDRSLALAEARIGRPAMPAAPARRLDSGAVGSLAAGYPLQLFAGDDPRLLDTASYLLDDCFHDGGFFQDMIHSGINPYLTLHVAQVLMRGNDPRAFDLLRAVASLASPTGQWPEAIHPRTRGGCMGDGQHAWAAAEWVLAMRNAFVREEGYGLVIGSGIPDDWLAAGEPLSYGPAPTPFGPLEIEIAPDAKGVRARWTWTEGAPRGRRPDIHVRLAGGPPVASATDEIVLERVP